MKNIALMDVDLTTEECDMLEFTILAASCLSFKNEENRRKMYDSLVIALEDHIIPAATRSESKVFYYTLLGEHHRNFSEQFDGLVLTEATEKAFDAYELGKKIAEAYLKPTNANRLQLALSQSVSSVDKEEFKGLITLLLQNFYAMSNSIEEAVEIAQAALDAVENDKTATKEELEMADDSISILREFINEIEESS